MTDLDTGTETGRPLSVRDRRRVGKDDGSVCAAEPNIKPSYVESLERRVERTEAAFRERVDQLQEETHKSRQRLEQDLKRRFEEKEKALLLEVLEILDDVERAAVMTEASPAVSEGLALISARTDQFLKRHRCRRDEPQGDAFDPATMEAVALQPGPKDTVVLVLQAGYRRGDEVLRPARVAVGSGE
jgi:molecular chaperone GrpE